MNLEQNSPVLSLPWKMAPGPMRTASSQSAVVSLVGTCRQQQTAPLIGPFDQSKASNYLPNYGRSTPGKRFNKHHVEEWQRQQNLLSVDTRHDRVMVEDPGKICEQSLHLNSHEMESFLRLLFHCRRKFIFPSGFCYNLDNL